MPSPGQAAIASSIGTKSFTVEGGFVTQFQSTAEFIQDLATAINAGWTCASPTTPSTMAAAFTSQFAGMLAGVGKQVIDCIAAGIDAEIAAWVASWNTGTSTHTYVVNSASIVSRIQACSPVWSNGAKAIAEAVADAFMSGFGQEVG